MSFLKDLVNWHAERGKLIVLSTAANIGFTFHLITKKTSLYRISITKIHIFIYLLIFGLLLLLYVFCLSEMSSYDKHIHV